MTSRDATPARRGRSPGEAGAFVEHLVDPVEPSLRSRWSSSLAEAGRAPGGAPAVIGVLTALLPQLDPDSHGLHALLETLQETSLRDGIALRDERLRAWLATVGGSGKAARTAHRLLG